MSKEQDQVYADLFITAIEGGVNYWASVSEYRWRLPNTDGLTVSESQDLRDFRAVIHDAEEDDETHVITRKTIVDGVRKLAFEIDSNPGSQQHTCALQCMALTFGRNLDGLDFDADDADMIVQAGLFGEVVYG